MKKLGKLSINLDKIIKNEELVNLRGGDDYYGDEPVAWDCYCNGKYLGEASSPDICDRRCAQCTTCW